MEQQKKPSIAGIATKYGLIQGVLSFVAFLVMNLAGIGMSQSLVRSCVGIAILVVLMVLAHREFKKNNDGMMTYAQGLGSGTLLATVAAVLNCIVTYVYVTYFNTGFLGAALKAQQAALEQRGMSGAQLDQAMSITSAIMTPVGVAVSGLISGVIVGFVVALIVSIFTQKADPRAVI
jgi:hypothetical protein